MIRYALPFALLAAAARSTPVSAQTPADTASVVRATAGVIGDSILLRIGRHRPPLLGEPTTAFDGSVTRELQDRHHLALMPTQVDTAEWVVTRGFTLTGDTAAVMIEVGTRSRSTRLIDTYIETNRYLFVRVPGGWELVRREFVRGADLGAVRG